MKILYVEDEIAHVELTQRTLEDNLIDKFVLYHREDLKGALEILTTEPDIDLVLTDLRLPDGSGLELLKKVKELPSPPAVVLVTGQGDQEIAVAALKAGAADYLVKQSDYLHRLPVVISNAVAQNRLLREQAAKREAEVKYQSLVEQTPAVVFLDAVDEKKTTLYISPRIFELTGYTPNEWCADPLLWENSIHPGDKVRIEKFNYRTHKKGERVQEEYRLIRRDERVVWIKEDTTLIHDKDGKPLYWQGILYDITKEKENEAALQRQLNELGVLQTATVAGTESYSEDEIIEKVTRIIGRIFPEVCGILLLGDDGNSLTPHPSYIGANVSNWQQGYPITEGITGESVSLGKIIRLGDVTKDRMYIEIASGIKSELCVPIQVNKRVIGVINVESREFDAFTENDERLLNTIASGLGTALERLRLFQEEQRRSRELETLYQTTKLLTQSLELHVIAENLISIIEQLLGYEYCAVALQDETTQQLIPLALSRKGKDQESYKKELQSLIEKNIQPGSGIVGWVIQNGKPLRSGDISNDPRYIKVWEGINSELCVPLIARDRTIGALNIETSRQNAYTVKDEGILTALASSAAIAFENARLFQEQNRRSKIIEALSVIANEIATTREILPILDKITQRTLTLLNAKHVALYILHDDNNTIKPISAQGAYRQQLLSFPVKIGEGITGKIVANGKPEIINDMTGDSRRKPVPGTPETDAQFETLMSAPLIMRGRVIGAINVWRLKEDGLFNETELNFLVSIADQASICIESGRLFQETRRQAQEAAAIAEVGRDISSTLQLNAVLDRIALYAKDLLHAESSAVYLANDDGSSLRAIAAIGLDAEAIKNDPLTIGTGILGNIALQKFGEFVNDTTRDARTIIIKGTEQNPYEHIMGVPILFSEKLTGLLAVWRTGNGEEFVPAELEFASRLAQQAAIALENARLYESELIRREQAENLREVTASLSTTLDISTLYQIILDSLSNLVAYDSSSIFLEHGQGEMEIVAARGFTENIVGKRLFKTAKWHNLVMNRKALIMSDAQTDPKFEKWEASKHIHGWMGVPMISQDKVIGFINVDSTKVNAFTEKDATIVQTLANSAAVAIQNAFLLATEREQRKREAAMLDLMRVTTSSLELNKVMQTILGHMINLIPSESGTIQLLKDKTLHIAATQGFQNEILSSGQVLALENFPINRRVIETKLPIWINDTKKNPDYQIVEGIISVNSFMAIPLIYKGEAIGIATLDSNQRDRYKPEDAELALALANHAAIALTNARLYEEALRASERRAVLHRISQDIIRFSQDAEQVYTAIHESAGKLMPCDVFIIALHDHSTNEIDFVYTVETGYRYKLQKTRKNRGLTAKIIDTGKSIIWAEPAEIEQNDVEHFGQSLHVQSVIGVPMKISGRVIGTISAQCYEPHAYGAEEQALLEMLAAHAATAIENSRLYDETQRRLKELEIINRVSTSLRMAQSLDEMLPILLNETLELINTHHGSIWLYDHSSNMLKQHISSGAEAKLQHTSLMPYQGIVGHTFTTGKRYIASEIKNDPMLFEENRESMAPGLGGCYIPIQSTAGPVGVLVVLVDTGRQISDEFNLLGILAEITGNAIHRSQLYEQSQRQVRRLTTLRDIDAAIASSFDLRLTLTILMDQTLTHLNVDAVDIALYHPDLQSLTYMVGNGFRTSSPTRPQMRIGEGLAGQVIMRQSTYHVTDLQNVPESRNEALVKREGFVTYIGIPLIVKGQIKGVFEIFHRTPLSTTPDWMDFLHTLAGQAAIAIDNSHLFENLQRSNQELMQAYDTTLEGWARALELRDRETEGHTRRVTELTLQLAKYMGIKDSDLVNIRRGVLLHDIGKMGVPDNILKKTGPLTDAEWSEMRQHPVYAYNLLSPIEYLRDALEIPYSHHEHWDGSGYPRGLKGAQIPLSARIFSIIDIWDALLSDRTYRKAWPREKVIEYLKEIKGKHVDPNVLNVFFKMLSETETETG